MKLPRGIPRRIRPHLINHQYRQQSSTIRHGLPSKTIKQLLDDSKIGEHVEAYGWVLTARTQRKVAFAEVVDGSSNRGIQAVMSPEVAQR